MDLGGQESVPLKSRWLLVKLSGLYKVDFLQISNTHRANNFHIQCSFLKYVL